MTHTILSFLKFGNKKNIEDLFNNGTIYLNTVQYFRGIEDNNLRGDDYEGASRVINSLPGSFKIPGIEKEINYKTIHLKESYETVLGNIFCLYCISSYGFPNISDFKIDEKVLDFGPYCILINDVGYFLDSIETELKKNKFEFEHGFVKYYDKKKINKELYLFEKPNEFEYQKEFRIYVYQTELTPISIKIGSLEGKAEIFRTEDILKLELKRKS